MGNNGANETDGGPDFEVEISLPVVVGDALEGLGVGSAGIIDHDVHAAEIVHCGLDHTLRRGRVRDVPGDGQHHTLGGCPNFLGRLVQEVGSPGNDDDLGAFLGKAMGSCFSYAVAAAGDYGDFVSEPQVHEPASRRVALTETHYNNRPHFFKSDFPDLAF